VQTQLNDEFCSTLVCSQLRFGIFVTLIHLNFAMGLLLVAKLVLALILALTLEIMTVNYCGSWDCNLLIWMADFESLSNYTLLISKTYFSCAIRYIVCIVDLNTFVLYCVLYLPNGFMHWL